LHSGINFTIRSTQEQRFLSGSEAKYPHILLVLPIDDEFCERIALGGNQEKMGQRLTHGVCNNELGWRNAGSDGSEP
jgi:hypothetical protein